ncbi:hypothetical protein K443DRAFT_676659 [Laccaria amethystina LaAM-08-1]|uniref:Uncharacterized protein n=1 Tax=Laccaria amethystina LaAM-08-1 TaxID=1095629 RepID=A0A0C9WVI1_9AGAR|nr:hypothetical protein K443DRAFT_676659 [Laccaria amethystina LaAM-08-1]
MRAQFFLHSQSSFSRRDIKPLPSWLANTFSTLVADHPLRLLLPTPRDDEPVEEQDSSSALEDVFVFNLPEPSDARSDSSSSYGFTDGFETFYHDKKDTPPNLPSAFSRASAVLGSDNQPLPFSTPGPDYARSSLPVLPGNINPLTNYPYASSVSFPSPAVSPSSAELFQDAFPNTTNNFISDSTIEGAAYIEHAPAIYSTPGPGYVTHHLHFDSPIEEPTNPDASQPQYDIDYDSLDFRWKPFNRKGREPRLVQPADTYLWAESHESDQALDQNDSQLPSKEIVSPSPFRFLPPMDDKKNTPPPQPSLHGSTGAKSYIGAAFAPAKGVFISPLRSQPTPSSPVQVSFEQPKSLAVSFPRDLSPINMTFTQKQPSKLNAAFGKYDEACSQLSNDSIDSWGDEKEAQG